MLTAEEVADAMVLAWTSAEPGAAYVIQPGVGTIPYTFKGVPSAKTAAGRDRRRPGGAAPAVDALTRVRGLFDRPVLLGHGPSVRAPGEGHEHEIRSEIDIEAPPEAVGTGRLGRYEEWNPFITRAEGTAEAGQRLSLRMQPSGGRAMTIRPTVTSASQARPSSGWVTSGCRGCSTAGTGSS